MIRDMDMIRIILCEMESSKECLRHEISIDGYDKDTINYYLRLLRQSGLVNTNSFFRCADDSIMVNEVELTWKGYDFLEYIRDDKLWNKVKDSINQKGLPMLTDTIEAIAGSIISEMASEAIKN